ncbi:hypothetical protein [Succinimonas amylolytica]|uniref:hypothetical protein n=1 Tax=Succinimonas amylolytica TaxID=83769 RepID=UPI0003A8B981|nr:hypothetical protein [Succinimonas amylolytica]
MNMKRFSLTRSAAAVMTVIMAGTMMTACGGSKSSSGNNVVLEFRDGDYLAGKPYRG